MVAWGVACSARAPANPDDSCAIFSENTSWYRATASSYRKWGVPIGVQLAIIRQESGFDATARPDRTRILGLVPGPRPSSSYGYAQALTTTWLEYMRETGNWGADRDDFADAADFVGWYAARSTRTAGIANNDAYRLYLAYHEGDGGYLRRSYRGKPWLLEAARTVQVRAARYERQLLRCRAALAGDGWGSRLFLF